MQDLKTMKIETVALLPDVNREQKGVFEELDSERMCLSATLEPKQSTRLVDQDEFKLEPQIDYQHKLT